MKYYVYCLVNDDPYLYSENMQLFVDKKYARAEIRRHMRRQYLKGVFDKSWFSEYCMELLGEFDSETGDFVSYPKKDREKINLLAEVEDLFEE